MGEIDGTYKHLGVYSDWVAVARARLAAGVPEGAVTPAQQQVRATLGFVAEHESPIDPWSEGRWEHDGVAGESLSWSVGYGPRTQAWLLRPAGVTGPLPGVVALHDHGGYKWYGRQKIADGPSGMSPHLAAFRAKYYGGRAYANELARRGYAVLVPDTFLWGSRWFPIETMPGPVRALVAASRTLWEPTDGTPAEIAEYNAAAGHHELILEKYCALLGTTLAGVVSYEDRVAVNYLRGRDDVIADRIGAVGLSGGGNRAGLLAGSGAPLAATVVVGLMSTYEGLLDHNVAGHTWMFFPHGWSRHGDWPDLVAAAAPTPLLVQYDLDDHLFTREGMEAAHARLTALYERAGAPDAYAGQFYPGPHQFDLPMQEAAFSWLDARLSR